MEENCQPLMSCKVFTRRFRIKRSGEVIWKGIRKEKSQEVQEKVLKMCIKRTSMKVNTLLDHFSTMLTDNSRFWTFNLDFLTFFLHICCSTAAVSQLVPWEIHSAIIV